MEKADLPHPASMYRELEQGLTLAQQEHYGEALTHLTRARGRLESAPPQLLARLDAFVQGHDRYCEAEQALHEASERFAAAVGERRARLHDLRQAFAAASADENLRADWWPHGEEREDVDLDDILPPLSITCFGRFQVRQAGRPIPLCQNRNGQAILRYLAVQPDHRVAIDTLLEALWPDQDPEVGRHKLYVASSALRRALNGEHTHQKGTGYLLCENGAYELNPGVRIQIDVDDFLTFYRAGQRAEGSVRVENFEAACRLYTGGILPDDQYADWAISRREQLARMVLSMFAALAAHYLAAGQYRRAAECALRTLEEDRCDETAVRQLMRAYLGDGRRHEALRRYHLCRRTLSDELGVTPMPETTALYQAILHDESLPPVMPEDGFAPDGRRAILELT